MYLKGLFFVKVLLLILFVSCGGMSADDYLHEGQRSMRKQRTDEAFKYFEKAIEKDPSFSQAYVERARIFFVRGNIDEALEDFTKAIELDPENSDAYYGRGRLFQFRNNMPAACEDWVKARDLNHHNIEEALHMCRAYL